MLNEIIGVAARWNGLLTRKFNITGGAPAPQLTPEIGASYTLDSGPEDLILRGDRLFTCTMTVNAVAAKRGVAQLGILATSSGFIVVVEEMRINNITAIDEMGFAVGKVASGLAQAPAAGTLTGRETRLQPNAGGGFATVPPAASVSFDQGPATILAYNLANAGGMPAGSVLIYDKPVILSPGWCVQASIATVNVATKISFAWREVPVAPGEIGPF